MKLVSKNRWIEIYVPIYKMSVIVTWEQDIDRIIKTAKKHGVKISNEWKGKFNKCSEGANGVCMIIGDANTDIIVWLKEKPLKASQFGTLYHELYHAVDNIAADHNLENEREARAYVFEFLVNKCNKVL